MRILCAIPAFNEEVAIASVVLLARKHADEVVVVDDGSKDRTVRVAELAGARVIKHTKNGGYGAALRTIFAEARRLKPDVLVILDSDGQHNADDIPRLTAPVLAGEADLVIGSRFLESGDDKSVPAYRKAGIKVLTGLSNVGSTKGENKTTDGQSGYRAYGPKAIAALELKDSDMGISAEILFEARKAGLRFKDVPIQVRYDVEGSSQGPIEHGLGVIASILRYVEREHPIKAVALPGIVLLALGLLLAGLSFRVYFASGFLPFGPTVGSAALTTVGLLLAFTGLILHAIVTHEPGRT